MSILDSSKPAARARQFLDISTPATLVHTRRGAAPHLTPDLLAALPVSGFHVPIAELITMPGSDFMETYGKGIHAISNLQGYPMFFSVRDPMLNDFGPSNATSYSVYGQHGKQRITVESYMKLQAAFHPNAFGSLSDEIPAFSSMSRASKSITRSLNWLDGCIELHAKEGAYPVQGQKPLLFATVQGGVHEKLRRLCATEMGKRDVDGFVLGGFCCGESPEERRHMVQVVLECLPQDKPRMLSGLLGPVEILDMILLGVDLLDSPYPYRLTRLGNASVYDVDISLPPRNLGNKLNLRDKQNERDDRVLLQGCTCYTCTNHHRAYIHHLLNVHEMLADTLLMIHNLHHHLLFFDYIRKHTAAGSLDTFREEFARRFFTTQEN